jgi:hypothetical protein
MKQKTVTIEIDDQGNSSIDLDGFEGKGCTDIAKAFQSADSVVRSKKKREFHLEGTASKEELRRKC